LRKLTTRVQQRAVGVFKIRFQLSHVPGLVVQGFLPEARARTAMRTQSTIYPISALTNTILYQTKSAQAGDSPKILLPELH